MDPEIKRLLEETRALAKDNHDMLRSIRRHQRYSAIWTVIVWVIVLALPLYLYQQYMQPIVARFSSTSTTTTSGMFGLQTIAELQKLINSFKSGQ